MKRILSFVLCLTMIMSFASVVNAEHYSKFTDVTQDSWYYGRTFFQAQLPNLIKAINRLADAMEKQNELKEEEKKNDQSKN